jgi:hypothetical protein
VLQLATITAVEGLGGLTGAVSLWNRGWRTGLVGNRRSFHPQATPSCFFAAWAGRNISSLIPTALYGECQCAPSNRPAGIARGEKTKRKFGPIVAGLRGLRTGRAYGPACPLRVSSRLKTNLSGTLWTAIAVWRLPKRPLGPSDLAAQCQRNSFHCGREAREPHATSVYSLRCLSSITL